jgi:hypothetical protein
MKALKLLNLPNFKWLVSQFERIKMLKDETFHEFYIKNNTVSDAKLIKKILISLPERFRIKVTSIEESKDLDDMKPMSFPCSLSRRLI